MTNEEMERAIEFLLKSQANFEARLEQREAEWARREAEREAAQAERDARLDARFEQTDRQIAAFADLQADLMRVVTRTFGEQAHINEEHRKFKQSVRAAEKLQEEFNQSVRAAEKLQKEFNESVREASASQRVFNEAVSAALTRLAESQAHTDRRLDALIDIVRGERNGG
ncbi:MAG TPA: hypothetical protein VFS10_08235 [Pyrinomonadaceae bacterium]|nr:hypothetical protein [Pyrinomonadaceae bacterium]